MPIKRYFSRRDGRRLTMPRVIQGTADANGFVPYGDVLTGKHSVQEVFAREARWSSQTRNPGTYVGPDDYDPVLQFHLRIEMD